MQLHVPPGTVLTITLSSPDELQPIIELAKQKAKQDARREALSRVYTLTELTQRMKMSRTTLLKFLKLPVAQGGIDYSRAGIRYLVTEQSVREWFGDTQSY